MDTIPQNAPQTKRELVILTMRGGQTAMQSALALLVQQGTAGEQEAATLMRHAAHHFTAAAVLLNARPTS